MNERSTPRFSIQLLLCVLPLLALVVHIPTFSAEATLDDRGTVLDNPVVQGDFSLSRLMSANIYGDRPGYVHVQNFRPLTTVSYRLGPRDSLVYQRLINLLIHILCCILVVLLARRMKIPAMGAWIGSLWFAVHPVHVDAIIPLNNRSDLLCCALILGAALSWWSATRKRDFALAVFLGFLAALAKEQGVIVPVLFLFLEWSRSRAPQAPRTAEQPPPAPRRPWRWVMASFGLLVLVFVLRFHALGGIFAGNVPPSDNPLVLSSGAERWMSPGLLVVEAIRLLAAPARLSADYTADAIPLAQSWLSWTALLGWVTLITACILFLGALRAGRTKIVLVLGGGLLTYGVVSNTAILSTILFSERALYIPTAFLALGLGLLTGQLTLLSRRPLRAMIACASLLFVFFGIRSYDRATEYRNSEVLARSSLSATPRSARMLSVLGASLRDKKQLVEAIDVFKRATRADPRCASAHRGLGTIYWEQEDYVNAARSFDDAVRASRGGDVYAAVQGAAAYLRIGKPKDGIRLSEIAVAIAPDQYKAWTNLARNWFALGDKLKALALMEDAVARFSTEPMVLWYTTLFRIQAGSVTLARDSWEQGRSLQPVSERWRDLGQQMGWIDAQKSDPAGPGSKTKF